MVRIRLVALLSLLLFFSSLSALKCTKHVHCDDGNPETHDVCFNEHGMCLSFSTDRQQNSNTIRDIKDITAELNKAPISATAKMKTAQIAARMFQEFNPNLFVYRNVGGADPAKALNRFAKTITRQTSNFEFHNRMAGIFRTANDFHTQYIIPDPLAATRADLGFTAQVFYAKGDVDKQGRRRRRYIVSEVIKSLIPDGPGFGVGVELLRYNNMTIDSAVLREGDLTYASNLEARVAEGTLAISQRLLSAAPLPKTAKVMIEYRTSKGVSRKITLPWIYMHTKDEQMAAAMKRRKGMDTDLSTSFQRIKQSGPNKNQKIVITLPPKTSVRVTEEARANIFVEAAFRHVFFAERIPTKSGTIARLVIKTFNAQSNAMILQELLRILQSMPTGGLIVDIRGNGGGSLNLAEDMAFIITGGLLSGFPVAWRATRLVRDSFVSIKTTSAGAIDATIAAVNSALRIKEPISGPSVALFERNTISSGGFYGGPIITLTDARTYSAAEFYAGMQVDERMSLLVGTAGATGGGGALVVSYNELTQAFPDTLQKLPSLLAQFRTAYNRFFRSGFNTGGQYEYFGVEPDVRYFPTRGDALKDDCDLYEFLGARLKKLRMQNTTT